MPHVPQQVVRRQRSYCCLDALFGRSQGTGMTGAVQISKLRLVKTKGIFLGWLLSFLVLHRLFGWALTDWPSVIMFGQPIAAHEPA